MDLIFILLVTLVEVMADIMDMPNNSMAISPPMSDEKRLIRGLLGNYDEVGRNGRPVLNMSTTIDVQFGLGLIQMDLDEKYKVLKMSMWSRYRWRDEYMQWNPDEFGGVDKVRLASSLLWIPDIMLYNSADPKDEVRDVLAVVEHTGYVVWVPHQIFKSSCSLDVTNFPFDFQTCNMWFGSWTHTKEEVDVHMAFPSGIDLSTFQSDYLESSDWDIEKTIADKKILPSANETPNYAVLTFQLNMKRKLVFSSYILTLPCVFLACLTLVVFWLPPDRPDRTALGFIRVMGFRKFLGVFKFTAMSIFASFLLLLLILVEAAPPTASSVPVLGVYYCFNMVIIMLSVFLSSLVVNICRAGENRRKVPRWLHMITVEILGRIMLMRKSLLSVQDKKVNRNSGMHHCQSSEGRIVDFTSERPYNVVYETKYDKFEDKYNTKYSTDTKYNKHNTTDNKFRSILENGDAQHLMDSQMKEMHRSLSHIRANLSTKTSAESHQHDIVQHWRDVALVLDRFFFVLYIILIVVSLAVLFPRPTK